MHVSRGRFDAGYQIFEQGLYAVEWSAARNGQFSFRGMTMTAKVTVHNTDGGRKMINTEHKDRLFCFIFGSEENKKWTLSLYNAVNGSAHTDPDMIQITTMKDILYMGMKNDVSFMITDIMVRVRMININYGQNKEVLSACKPLEEYAWLIHQIREYRKQKEEIEDAVDHAIEDLPEEFEIRTFLVGHKAEVKDMCITEYNEAETMQMIREEGKEEGREEGRQDNANETAERMIQANEPGDKITLYTGLEKSDVDRLAKKMNTVLVWNMPKV